MTIALSRRAALQAAAALVVAGYLPGRARAQAPAGGPFAPNAYVRIGEDSVVTVISRNLEFGQGPLTGFATLIAEELDADWSQVRAEHAPANTALYTNPAFGFEGTGGSSSMTSSYDEMRRMGAVARAMLVAAAADAWKVPAGEITIDKGVLRHASGREGRFGDFVAAASKLAPPDAKTVALKDPAAFRLAGSEVVRRLDARGKVTGKPQYTIDVYEPGMLTVTIARPPRFGAAPESVDDEAARAVPGVVDVKALPMGVAVYGEGMWAAMQGRKALKIVWDESKAETRGTDEILASYRELAATPGAAVGAHGDVAAALAEADQVIEQVYEFPYLAHAPMEPINGFISWTGGAAVVKLGCQSPTIDQAAIAGVLGLPPEKVELQVLMAGGSFGRRGQFANLFAVELALAAKMIGPGRPIKVQWTREDDVAGGYYRPLMVHRLRGGVKDGKITAWADTVVGQSVVKGTPLEAMMTRGGVDASGVEGVSELPYRIPNFSCDAHNPEVGIQPQFWRSVGHSHTGYAKECFLDELLAAAGADPVEGRLALLDPASREARVLEAAAEMAQWTGPRPAEGRARGVAVVTSFGTAVAQIAEVSRRGEGFKVDKIWCAVDCGLAVNPDIVRQQMEGGIGYGLGHALYARITLTDGVVDQKNFDSYRALRMNEAPAIEVRILPSASPPTGVGEPGVPPAGPAVANALAALGLPRARSLPIVGVKA